MVLEDYQGPHNRQITELVCKECHKHIGWLFTMTCIMTKFIYSFCDHCYPPSEAPERKGK